MNAIKLKGTHFGIQYSNTSITEPQNEFITDMIEINSFML